MYLLIVVINFLIGKLWLICIIDVWILLLGVCNEIVKFICSLLFVNLWIFGIKLFVEIVIWWVLIVKFLLLLIVCKKFMILV